MRRYIFLIMCISLAVTSCDNDILNETPKDFLTPENSYTNKAGFDAALADVYKTIRDDFYADGVSWKGYDLFGVDIDLCGPRSSEDNWTEYFFWNTLNADNSTSEKWWNRFYGMIYQCNAIINRAQQPEAKWNSEADKDEVIGEAKFLRAFCYRFLANMWGNVPIVTEETTRPKFNYTNSKQEDVYKLCKEDLEYAIQYMPDIDNQIGGRASKVAAQHLLSEILICLNDYKGAIAQASAVINNPAMSLMTERFGVYKNFKFNGWDYRGPQQDWGDVYWDLFREGNFNRTDGNKECIWNVQFDPDIPGGGSQANEWTGWFSFERFFGTPWWRLKDKDGVSNWLKDTLSGRPIEQISITEYAANQIWKYKNDWNNDIRNSTYNIHRDYYWTNPSSRFYGQKMTKENLGDPSDYFRIQQPIFVKFVTAIHHGKYGTDASSGEKHDIGRIYKDWYIMRLAETYLLRAEAYLKAGDKDSAAKDINTIRARAHATPVTPDEVTLDLILDERARELFFEDFRLNTLMRMNKLSEYLMKYNPCVKKNGYKLDNHINKLPIPNREIEANSEGGLIQNDGYK